MSKWKSKIKNISWLRYKEIPKVQQFKRKIVGVSLLILTVIFIIIIFITRTGTEIYQNQSIDSTIKTIFANVEIDDVDTVKINNAVPFAIRFFIIVDAPSGIHASTSGSSRISDDKAIELYKSIQGKISGNVGDYRYQVREIDKGKIAVFVDITKEIQNRQDTTMILVVILLGTLLLLSVIVSFSSRLVIKPFVESYEQQKQFITDASHDLKTPLAVIMSNADVLEFTAGKSEWTSAIKKETHKMSELIDDMLTLSKVESFTGKQERTFVDVSAILNSMADELFLLWQERKITVVKDLPVKTIWKCNEKQITRLFSVIMQNATKYCLENGTFKISLAQQKNKLIVSMYNDADVNEEINYDKLFERFYRNDSSRNSSTGGHGIGLSIAKKICDLEGYDISAAKQDNGIVFTIVLT